MKKKKKQKAAKRRPRAHYKKKRITRSSSKVYGNYQYIDIPPISEIEAPEGYRAVSMSHALMEYSKPVMDFVEKGIVEDMNEALQITMRIRHNSLSNRP